MKSYNMIKRKTIKGLLWSFIDLFSRQIIVLITQVILARLLLPEYFGLIGMITIFVSISTSLVQSGLDQALIREKNPKQLDYSTVFFFNLCISVFIYSILFTTAPFIASYYGESELVAILRVLMLVVIINALSVIQRVILIRSVDFKTQTKITIIASLVSGMIAITFAVLGLGVWSLVAQQLSMQFIMMILLTLNNRWVPSLKFNIRLFKYYFKFGYKLLFSGLIGVLQRNIYFVIIGKIYTPTNLGYYTNASKLRDISSQTLSQALQRVTYPILSKFKDDPRMLSTNYRRLIRSTAFIHFPIIMALSAISPILIPLVLGSQWEESVPFFQLLSVVGMLYPIQALNLNILKVVGRTDVFLALSIIKTLILFVLLSGAIYFEISINGLIIVAILHSFISLMIHSYVSSKFIKYNLFTQLFHLFKIMIPSFIMFIIMNFVGQALALMSIYMIVIQLIIGLVFYLIISFFINRWELKSTLDLIKEFK
ncbi:lipopolysaccharide biosynthesis protein [Gracilibacillus saliphilus]|uniref:lipopolysaccharide biosynthesis protein n=1 Tax=Gracilibacillus saliphilus TaxID=543890 RepID=UPI0013D0989F|nr:lipopolysaccharide biosynthesis protein [Gracilibacillus saliphilus]